MLEYAETVEAFLVEAFTTQVSQDEEMKATLSDEDIDFYEEDFAMSQWKLSERFPQIFRYSLFATCFSFLDHSLYRLCKAYKNLGNISLSSDDIRGSDDIERYQNYLKKVVGLEFPDQTSAWQDIRAYQKIRNKVVHNDGVLVDGDKDTEDKIKPFVKAHSSIKLKPFELNGDGKVRNWRIWLDKGFCPEFIGVLKQFSRDFPTS